MFVCWSETLYRKGKIMAQGKKEELVEWMNIRESENSESKLLLVSFKILSKEKCAKRSQYKLSIQNHFR